MPSDDDDWQVVATFVSAQEAEVACALLRSEGIECFLQGAQHRSMVGFLGAYIQPRLMVRADAVARALELLPDEDPEQGREDVATEDASEARELDTLVVDLSELTIFTLGAGAPGSRLEILVGAPSARFADDEEDSTELHFAALGAVVFLDRQSEMSGFIVVAASTPEHDGFEEFQGFWEPGATIRPPSYAHLLDTLGTPRGETQLANDTRLVEWQLERAGVYATFRQETLVEIEVQFKSSGGA
jgi:hypothetical protein